MTTGRSDDIDAWTLKDSSDEIAVIITDDQPWGANDAEHFRLLQNEIIKYAVLITCGEFYKKLPESIGKRIVIEFRPKYPLSSDAERLVQKFTTLSYPSIWTCG